MNRNTKKAISDVSDPNVNTKTKINVYFLLQIVNKTFNDFNWGSENSRGMKTFAFHGWETLLYAQLQH